MSAKFTFFGEGDKIEVRITQFENHPVTNRPKGVWVDSTVTVESGAFFGSFKASLTTDDLVCFRDQLKSTLKSHAGTVTFRSSGGGLSLSINLNGEGKTSISGVAQPKRLPQGVLYFEVDTDIFALIRAFRELEGAVREFPSEQTGNHEQILC
jgi:hypothetical protein